MTPQDRQNRRVAILKFVRENIPFLPESSCDLYPQARQCKELGLYSQKTFIGDIANRLWWLRKEMPVAEQEKARRIALAAPELLEACYGAESVLSQNGFVGGDVLNALRAAIAKAEGRTQ